jgi:hypothetical protein
VEHSPPTFMPRLSETFDSKIPANRDEDRAIHACHPFREFPGIRPAALVIYAVVCGTMRGEPLRACRSAADPERPVSLLR